MRGKQLSLLFLLNCLLRLDAFVLSLDCETKVRARRFARSYDEDDEDDVKDSGIPQLPAIGSSSFGSIPKGSLGSDISKQEKGVVESKDTAFVGRKFELQYTCNVCDTRNQHRVSRLAYRQGVVITRCKGCDSQHLIADNLGWTDYKGGFEGEINDIEDFFASQGKKDAVNRVTQEVFDLEFLLSRDTSSGSIVGENGDLAME